MFWCFQGNTACFHCQLVSPCVDDMYFFSLCSSLDGFKNSFCDDCIFHFASAVSLHWIEPRFHSNLDLPMYQAPHRFSCLPVIVLSSWFYISGFCYWLFFFFSTKCFHHSGFFAPTRFCKMVPMVTLLNIFLCALVCPLSSLPSEAKVVSWHPIHTAFIGLKQLSLVYICFTEHFQYIFYF